MARHQQALGQSEDLQMGFQIELIKMFYSCISNAKDIFNFAHRSVGTPFWCVFGVFEVKLCLSGPSNLI
jgi:hypothetical protein